LPKDSYLDSFDSVFDLVDSSLRGERVNTTIVLFLTMMHQTEIMSQQSI